MPVAIDYDERLKLIRIELSGAFSANDYKAALLTIGGGTYPVDAHSVWDVRDLDFSTVDWETIKAMKSVREEASPRRPTTRSAAVVDGPVERSLIKLFLEISADDRPTPRIYYTVSDAEHWCLTGTEPR